jgi:integrase
VVTVQLDGVHVVTMRLASGKLVEYHYAWRGKGAPRLTGAPGSPEYLAAYNKAHESRKKPVTGTLRQAIATYKASAAFEALSEPTRRAYRYHLDLIQAEFGDAPFKDLEDKRFRADALDWRDTMRQTPRAADYAMGTLKRLLDHAEERGLISANVLEKVKRLHKSNRADSIWTADEMAAFVGSASKELRWAVGLALHTGLRQSDLIKLPWGAFDGTSFIDRTSKTRRDVLIPAGPECQALMRSIEKRHLIILTTQRGKSPWTADGLRSSFRKACAEVGIKKTFHDLRRTACTNLLCAGVEASKVAMIMGWSEDEVEALKRKYVSRAEVVKAVLAQLEKGR